MTRKFLNTYALTAGSLLICDWFLLWARFYWFGFGDVTKWIFSIVNFPWSVVYFWCEAKPNSWWYESFGRRFEFLLNDEFSPMLLFLIIVLIQAMVFTFIISSIGKTGNKQAKGYLRPI
ncbi:MAG: hypothetical protein PVF83_09660 [Anaerolineales bacterium]|jgi:hypothetical protein